MCILLLTSDTFLPHLSVTEEQILCILKTLFLKIPFRPPPKKTENQKPEKGLVKDIFLTRSGAIIGKRSVRLSRSARLLPIPSSSFSEGVVELTAVWLTALEVV